MNLTNWSVNSGRQRVPLRDNVRWVRVQEFGQYMYKESFSEDEMWKLVNILPAASGVDAAAAAPDLQRFKSDNIPIKKAKWHDIQKQKPYIPMTLLDFYDNLTCSVNEESDTNMDSDAEDENLPGAKPSSSVQTTSSGRDLPAVAADHGDQYAIAVKKAKRGTVLKASRAKSPATEKDNLPIRKSRRKCSVQTTSSDPDLPAAGVDQLAIPVNKVRRVSVLKASSAELPANECENLPVKKSRRKCSVQTTSSVPDLPAVGDDQLAIAVKKARRSSVLKASSTDYLPSKSRSRKFIN